MNAEIKRLAQSCPEFLAVKHMHPSKSYITSMALA